MVIVFSGPSVRSHGYLLKKGSVSWPVGQSVRPSVRSYARLSVRTAATWVEADGTLSDGFSTDDH